jgi:hypothetical protein
LVAEAFLGPKPAGRTVNHKNGEKTDNRPENLEYVTRSENQHHAYETGLQGRGQKHGRAKLTNEQVREIRRRFDNGENRTRMGKEFGVSQGLISQIGNRRIWKHIDNDLAGDGVGA